jgi:hypothetical protein
MKIYTEIEIKNKLNTALDKLYVKDWYLLEKSVHERSITHKLAEYLQVLFPDYDVDCEYNNDIDKRKTFISNDAMSKLKEELKKIDLNPESKNLLEEIKKLSKNFYPDIIVHKRNTNKHNVLIIEAKKDNTDTSFDEVKLTAMTQNHYNYQLGVSIILSTNANYDRNQVKLKYFPLTKLKNDTKTTRK